MIWALIYLILLFIMISSALLAGMRRHDANFFAERADIFADSDEIDKVKVSA
jgi:hypothetical protein